MIQDEKASELKIHILQQKLEQESYKKLKIDHATNIIIHNDLKTFTYQQCKSKDNRTCLSHEFDLGYFYYKSFSDGDSLGKNNKT